MRSIASEWNDLVESSSAATPFQSPGWLMLIHWWHAFGSGRLCAFALRKQNRLVGIAPFFIWRDPENGTRRVLLLGTGNSDHLDAVVANDFQQTPVITAWSAALPDALNAIRSEWEVCDFQELPANSALLHGELPAGWADEISEQTVCPVVDLRRISEQTKKMLDRAATKRRRLDRLGECRVTLANPENLADRLNELIRLHSTGWAARGKPGVLADPAVQSFHLSAAASLLESGALRLYLLSVNGRNIASLYGFLMRGRFYSYLNGFDPEYSRYSPGSTLIGHAMEDSRRCGATEFDFLRGDENYKYRWGARNQTSYRRLIWRESIRGES